MDEPQEIAMFGETTKSMRARAMRTLAVRNLSDPVLLTGYAADILTDAQEMLRLNNPAIAGQLMNKAKYFIYESLSLQRKPR